MYTAKAFFTNYEINFVIVASFLFSSVNKTDIFAPCNIKSCIAGIGKTAVFFMNNNYSRILFSVFLAYRRTVVGRTVVDENQFKIRKSLRKDAVNTTAQVRFYVIYGNNYT